MDRRDPLFLAITRTPNAFGVSLWGFLGASGGCVMLFSALVRFAFEPGWRGPLASAGISLTLYIASIAAMARLASWEPRWSSIITGWAQTRLLALPAAATRRFGGTTFRPGQGSLRTYEDVRDRVG